MQERRRSVRINARLPVAYKAPQVEGHGWSLDISAEGLGLEITTRMEYGVSMELRIGLPDSQKPIEVEAKVFWQVENPQAAEDGSRHFRTGLMFTHVSPEDRNRLDRFILAFLKGLLPGVQRSKP
ncbi:MAG: PilZ domain-containing protein [Kiritimatiellaeota bacterium]|nr:PilZ domain-containing protein [Kiritimatiellota bacterium]